MGPGAVAADGIAAEAVVEDVVETIVDSVAAMGAAGMPVFASRSSW